VLPHPGQPRPDDDRRKKRDPKKGHQADEKEMMTR
jgi:hypothetical protein